MSVVLASPTKRLPIVSLNARASVNTIIERQALQVQRRVRILARSGSPGPPDTPALRHPSPLQSFLGYESARTRCFLEQRPEFAVLCLEVDICRYAGSSAANAMEFSYDISADSNRGTRRLALRSSSTPQNPLTPFRHPVIFHQRPAAMA
jgi:hypothetical protein